MIILMYNFNLALGITNSAFPNHYLIVKLYKKFKIHKHMGFMVKLFNLEIKNIEECFIFMNTKCFIYDSGNKHEIKKILQ